VSRLVAFAVVCAIVLWAAPAFAADSGPPADVSAVRTAELASWPARPCVGTAPKISNVRVVGDYAVLEWDNGESGGMAAYHRDASGTWKRFMHGGGAFAAKDLEANGVPASVAKQLMPGSPG
jgi:hypothetical protein